MSPVVFAALLLISASQVLGVEISSSQYEEMMDTLTSVNKTVNKMYHIMATQKDRDMELVENAMKKTYEQLRTKREAPTTETGDSFEKIQGVLNEWKEGFTTIFKNITSSDVYKNVQQFGESIQTKGKELGAKIEETITNARKDNSDEKN